MDAPPLPVTVRSLGLFRTILFWVHLAAGLSAGLSIGIMCFTGAALAFEKQLVAWSENDARRVTPPAAATPRLSMAQLTRRVREARPDIRPSAVVVSADPRDAVTFVLGRDGALHANPYTGEVRAPASIRMHDFMHVMEDWHRVLALGGDQRPIGKVINGGCNLAFFFLAVSGLYLWWPRSWSWRSVKAVVFFNFRLAGRARDFNWHNVIGLWSAFVLIILTLTAVPISYRWGANLIYQLTGDTPPVQSGPGGAPAGPVIEIQRPSAESRPLDHDVLLASIQRAHPQWRTITLRLQAPGPRGGGAPGNAARRPAGASPVQAARVPAASDAARHGPQPAVFIVKEPGHWPRTTTTTLTLNPFSGEILKQEGHAALSPARRLRTWTRFLHTGEAVGLPGQLVAGLACVGGCFLVYTGFALSWRRFCRRKDRPAPAA